MYPCSNPELIAAVSEAGGLGVIQPISMRFVHGYPLRDGIARIRQLTDRPVGFNAIIEKISRIYDERMRRWVDEALEAGVRFFVTALGNPRWVVERVHAVGGVVFHDVTRREHALKALDGGVDGFICVNDRAGGHAGGLPALDLLESIADLGRPMVCAGGIGAPAEFAAALQMGYVGAQLGTRFIATRECNSHDDYKQAIIRARAADVVLTERISGVPCSVIRTPQVERLGTAAGPLGRRLLQHQRTKHWMRAAYQLRSLWSLRRGALKAGGHRDYWQAGKSVESIDAIASVADVVDSFRSVLSVPPKTGHG